MANTLGDILFGSMPSSLNTDPKDLKAFRCLLVFSEGLGLPRVGRNFFDFVHSLLSTFINLLEGKLALARGMPQHFPTSFCGLDISNNNMFAFRH